MLNPVKLNDRSYLIVEDEYLAASSLLMALEEVGANILGPISDVSDAIILVNDRSNELDGAVLDINLRGTMAFPLADMLLKFQIPFVFVTGYDCSSLPPKFRHITCLSKPCDEEDIVRFLAELPARSNPFDHPVE